MIVLGGIRAVRAGLAVAGCAALALTGACQGKAAPDAAGPSASKPAAPRPSDGAAAPSTPPTAVWFHYRPDSGHLARAARARLGAAKVKDQGRFPLSVTNFTFVPGARFRTWTEANAGIKGTISVDAITLEALPQIVVHDAAPAPCGRPAWLGAHRFVYPALAPDAQGGSGGPSALKAVQVAKRGDAITYKRLPAVAKTKYTCALMASGDGRHLVGTDGKGGAGAVDLAARTSRPIPGVGSFRKPPYVADVRGLSRDGGTAAVKLSTDGNTPGDGTRAPFASPPTLLDTKTGAKQPIPVKGKLIDATYLPGGGLLVRVAGKPANTLVLLVGGKEVKRWAEPAAMRTWGLVSVG